MNIERRTWLIGRLLAVLLILVSMRAAYWQLWRGRALDPLALNPVAAQKEYARLSGQPTAAPGQPESASLAQLPQPVIQRTTQLLSHIQRGSIYDRSGNLLAADSGSAGDYTRTYSDPSLAHVIGYASALRIGVTGLEATYNQTLLGLDRPDTEIDRMLHRPIKGSSLVLTIDSRIQQAATAALAGRPGAVIVLDAKTGAVLAMTSAPTFDPNQMNNPDYTAALVNNTNSVMLNRATQALYTPGSIFKTVTLIAGLESKEVTPKTIFDFGQPKTREDGHIYYTYEVDGGIIYDPNHKENQLTLQMCYVTSANAAFAKIADKMNPDTYIQIAQRFGFSADNYAARFPLELPVSEPQLANNLNDLRTNNLLRANTGYGQGELLVTPISMAMVVEAVVNNGNIPVPYLVESIKDPQGNVIRTRPDNHVVRGTMSASTATFVRESMNVLVNTFYGGPNFIPGVVAGGKTGTAQLGGEANPHGWFIGYATKGDRTLVIVTVLENAGAGSTEAVPVFRQVATAALGQ